MSRKCELCGKRIRFGNNVSHSKQHTRRSWLPNIQASTIMIDGEPQKVKVCTRCLRTQNKLSH